MKKYVLIASLCLISALAVGQTEKGQGFWSGNASLTYTSFKQNRSAFENQYQSSVNTFSFNRGVFFKDNWLAGGGLTVSLNTINQKVPEPNQQNSYKSTTVGTGLSGFIRRYWGKDQWRVFAGGGLSVNYGIVHYNAAVTNRSDENSFFIQPYAQVGAAYYLTDRIGLEASASSNSFPLHFSSFGLGLTILTGVTRNGPDVYEAPQTAKGRWILGGQLGFFTQSTKPGIAYPEGQRTTEFSIAPSVGWFVKKNLLLGVSIPIVARWQEERSGFSYGLNPYLKKYISDNRLRPFVAGNLSYQISGNKPDDGYGSVQKAGLAVSAGLAYLLGDRFIVEATLGRIYFDRSFYPKDQNIDQWTGGASATLQPSFSINYVFD
ncbi:PorT family protein [Larkinella humicola]|uniref:PorT family protein n=1 Tax=Larkinella humicola TaxID=2607654 RepID=A0A5N1JM81_9BACT|nr:PorT family protein [Larkinella humicola]KAA9356978.1 PorT family protein [Larkinella humicola]